MAAASKTASLLIKGYVDIEPMIAKVIEEKCTGCKLCENSCPYEAISFITKADKLMANVNPAICKGCGACVPDCPEDALEVLGYTHSQINSMIDSMLLEVKEC
jgi:heterodisulfide reductase subunit A